MKSRLKLTLVLILVSTSLSAQVADEVVYERLFYVCKAWGHVKYFHTATANGSVNWDVQLLNTLNGIKSAQDNASFNRSLLSMLNAAGEMGTSTSTLPNIPDSLSNNTDQSWMQHAIFSNDVQNVLETIRNRFRPQSNVYVERAGNGSHPSFENDDLYHTEADYPSENKRILALFRYWNIINYFFPYKYIMDQDWDTTLAEFIPQIVKAENALSYHLAFRKLTAKIDDSHAFFNSPTWWNWFGTNHAPFLARYIENEMVITKVLPGVNQVSVGEVVKAINGIDIAVVRDSLREYSYGSNEEVIEREINRMILWGPRGSFSMTLDNGTTTHREIFDRNSTNLNDLNSGEGPIWETTIKGNCNFGIVDMARLERAQVEEMFDDLWYTDAVIFDIRNYPNGTLWEIVNYIYPFDVHVANFTVPDITHPGSLFWIEASIGQGAPSPYEGEVIMLFDERTQSQAEYTAMGLEQFPYSKKIGSTTAGADGNIAWIHLPGNIRTAATFLGTYYPDYTPTQRIGIVPDFEVRPTIAGIRSGEDEVLNFALNCDLLEDGDIIASIDTFESLDFHPNPATNEVTYDLTHHGRVLIELYDLNGKRLLSTDSPSGTLDVSGFKAGVYLIKAHLKDRSITNRLIVSR